MPRHLFNLETDSEVVEEILSDEAYTVVSGQVHHWEGIGDVWVEVRAYYDLHIIATIFTHTPDPPSAKGRRRWCFTASTDDIVSTLLFTHSPNAT